MSVDTEQYDGEDVAADAMTGKEFPETPDQPEITDEDVSEEQDSPKYSKIELEALERGWKPMDKFSGDKDKYDDAKSYVKQSKLMGKITESNKSNKIISVKLAETQNALKVLTKMMKNSSVRSSEKDMDDLLTKKKEAFDEGDFNKLQSYEEKIRELTNNITSIQSVETNEEPAESPTISRFKAENAYWLKDPAMRDFAKNYANFLQQTEKHMDEEDVLNETKRQVFSKFNMKDKGMTDTQRAQPVARNVRPSAPMMEGGYQKQGTNRNSNAYDKMPQEIKGMIENMIKRAPSLDKNEYAQELINDGTVTV